MKMAWSAWNTLIGPLGIFTSQPKDDDAGNKRKIALRPWACHIYQEWKQRLTHQGHEQKISAAFP